MRSFFVKLLLVLISFVNSNQAVVFECDFSVDFNWAGIGNEYTCEAIILPGDSTILTNVTGTHLEGYSNDGVLALLVQCEEVLTRISRGIQNFFPHLQVMSWNSGSLTAIEADDLKPYPDLLQLVLSYNKIVSIDSDLFQHTPNLEWILFNLNLLQHVGHDLLTNLSNLTYASFQRNSCIDVLARTSVEIQELNLLLPIQCPPLGETTTTDSPIQTPGTTTTILTTTQPTTTTTQPPTTQPTTTTTMLTTTTTVFTKTPPEDCPIGCSSRIESVEKNVFIKTDELTRQNGELALENSYQNNRIYQLQIEVSDLSLAIVELSKQIREINSRP